MDSALRNRIAELMHRHAAEQTELLNQIVETYRRGEEPAALLMVGTVLFEIWAEALDPLYRQYPDLIPEGSSWSPDVESKRKSDAIAVKRAMEALSRLL